MEEITMKIYAIIYNSDNGLNCEDYREYSDTKLYSSLKEASEIYETHVSGKYEGGFELIEWEIDTNNKKTLKESPYINCTPYDPYEEEDKKDCYGDDDWEYIE